jgi:hypothetical protein
MWMALVFGLALFGCTALDFDAEHVLPSPPADGLRLASHNVHFIRLDKDVGAWSLADWEQRKAALDASFKHLNADIVGFQEMVSIG